MSVISRMAAPSALATRGGYDVADEHIETPTPNARPASRTIAALVGALGLVVAISFTGQAPAGVCSGQMLAYVSGETLPGPG